jgi:methylated-DNA-[protein]-cysteine S-methyltransferase
MTEQFNEKVWKAMKRIPKGRVATYAGLARAVGKPKAFRAVGNACNRNPDAPKVPCHRVVSSDGKIGGYAFGTAKKIALLAREGVKVKNGKVVNFEKRLVSLNAGKD